MRRKPVVKNPTIDALLSDLEGALVTPRQACELFHICRNTLSNWLDRGRLTRVKIGGTLRIRRDEINRVLEGRA
jgi:excisionase family DNA binding protein